jgi:hypothetical protein
MMNTNCKYCNNPLLNGGCLVRVGVGEHAHRPCWLRGENEERHFEDMPCVQCKERLSECMCCPSCGGREHSNYSDCLTCEDYQQRLPSHEYAKRHPEIVRAVAVDREFEAMKERRLEEEGVLN